MKAALSLVLFVGLNALVTAEVVCGASEGQRCMHNWHNAHRASRLMLPDRDKITRSDLKKRIAGVPKNRGVVAKFLKNIRPARQTTITCPGDIDCNEGTSCCPMTDGIYGCCPFSPSLCCPMNTCCTAADNVCCPDGDCCPTGSTCCGTDYCCENNGVCCGDATCCVEGYTCCTLSDGAIECCVSGGSSTSIRSFLLAWCLLLSTVFIRV